MAQHSITNPPEESIHIEVHDLTWLGEGAMRVEIRQRKFGRPIRTTSVFKMPGAEVDHLAQGVATILEAWLHGEERAVSHAAAAVKRAARTHASQVDRVHPG